MHRAAILECDFGDIYGSVEFYELECWHQGAFLVMQPNGTSIWDVTQQKCTLQQKNCCPLNKTEIHY